MRPAFMRSFRIFLLYTRACTGFSSPFLCMKIVDTQSHAPILLQRFSIASKPCLHARGSMHVSDRRELGSSLI